MYQVATRANVVELLLAMGASLIVGLLVLAGGAAIGEATTDLGLMTISAPASSDARLVGSEHEAFRPGAVLCCALIYADPNVSP